MLAPMTNMFVYGQMHLHIYDRSQHVRLMVCLIDCLFDCLCVVAAQNERHAAWEALFLQKTSATLHGSAPGGTPAAQNERHAAWEALFLKKTSATLHESAPGRPPGATRPPQDQDKTAH